MGRNDDINDLSKTLGPMNNKTINFSIYDFFSGCQCKGKLCNFKNASTLFPYYSIDFFKNIVFVKAEDKKCFSRF